MKDLGQENICIHKTLIILINCNNNISKTKISVMTLYLDFNVFCKFPRRNPVNIPTYVFLNVDYEYVISF